MRRKLWICAMSIVTVASTIGAAPARKCQAGGTCVPPSDCSVACCSGSCNACCARPVSSYMCSSEEEM
jgi:hypothetical protein